MVNQESTLARLGRAVNGCPQLQQVVQVPLQFRGCAANACGARNDGHALGVVQLVHGFFELCAFFALNATRNATTTGVVGHQHHITASQRDEGGQSCALVATFFFFDLHQQLLAFLDHIIDARLAGGNAFGKVLLGDFLEGQETVAVFTVVHKTSFQRGLYACHHGFVNVALALFAAFNFDFVVEQFLAVDNRQAAFFSLCRVNQHPLHDAYPFRCAATGWQRQRCLADTPLTLDQRQAL